jgi:hypothetical protein
MLFYNSLTPNITSIEDFGNLISTLHLTDTLSNIIDCDNLLMYMMYSMKRFKNTLLKVAI